MSVLGVGGAPPTTIASPPERPHTCVGLRVEATANRMVAAVWVGVPFGIETFTLTLIVLPAGGFPCGKEISEGVSGCPPASTATAGQPVETVGVSVYVSSRSAIALTVYTKM